MTRTAAVPRAPAREWSTSALLWVITLTVMSVFQFWRGAPIDGLIFTVITAVIVIERVVRMRKPASTAPAEARTTTGGTRRLVIMLAVALLVGIVIVVAPRTGPLSISLVVALGIGAVVLVWNHSPGLPGGSPQSRHRARIAWASIGITLCVWEALAYILSVTVPRGWIGFPTVSLLLEPAVDFDPSRALMTAAWLAAGVWLVAGTISRRSLTRAQALS